MTKETGGPAFMVAELANVQHEGMSLRDYFAAKAMQAYISNCSSIDVTEKEIAWASYAQADEMLKVRQQ